MLDESELQSILTKVKEAGFLCDKILPIQGPGWLL